MKDQYFSPGDKVVRISGNVGPNIYRGKDRPASPIYGKVYCVEDFWQGPCHNVVMLVGFGGWRYSNGMKVGWPANCFRKVEEVRLCVNAARQMEEFKKAVAQ